MHHNNLRTNLAIQSMPPRVYLDTVQMGYTVNSLNDWLCKRRWACQDLPINVPRERCCQIIYLSPPCIIKHTSSFRKKTPISPAIILIMIIRVDDLHFRFPTDFLKHFPCTEYYLYIIQLCLLHSKNITSRVKTFLGNRISSTLIAQSGASYQTTYHISEILILALVVFINSFGVLMKS